MTDPSQVPALLDVTEPNGTWQASQLSAFEGALTWLPNDPGLPPSQQLRDQGYENGAWWIGPGQMAVWHPAEPDSTPDDAPAVVDGKE